MKIRIGVLALLVAMFWLGGPVAPSNAAYVGLEMCSAPSATAPCIENLEIASVPQDASGWVQYDSFYGAMLQIPQGGPSAPAIEIGDVIDVTINFGAVGVANPYYSMLTTGDAESFTIDTSGTDVLVRVVFKVAEARWSNAMCSIMSCPEYADYTAKTTAMQILPLGNNKPITYSGSWLSTNAQGPPRMYWELGQFTFSIASPHFYDNSPSSSVNEGFYKFFLPRETLATVLGMPDVTAATFMSAFNLIDSVEGGGSVDGFEGALVSDLDGGILVTQPRMSFSTHTISLVPLPTSTLSPDQWLWVRQAAPMPPTGSCEDVDDSQFAYGTRLSGGWQKGWEPWVKGPDPSVEGGWACVRSLVNKGGLSWSLSHG